MHTVGYDRRIFATIEDPLFAVGEEPLDRTYRFEAHEYVLTRDLIR